MTSETRHLVQMVDIRGVEISCKNPKCVGKIVISPLGDKEPPALCPLCNETLFDPKRATWAAAKQLHSAIRHLLTNEADNVHIEVIKQ